MQKESVGRTEAHMHYIQECVISWPCSVCMKLGSNGRPNAAFNLTISESIRAMLMIQFQNFWLPSMTLPYTVQSTTNKLKRLYLRKIIPKLHSQYYWRRQRSLWIFWQRFSGTHRVQKHVPPYHLLPIFIPGIVFISAEGKFLWKKNYWTVLIAQMQASQNCGPSYVLSV